MHDPHDTTPLSPLSQSSSGYFSTSVSTVTLSDVLQPSSSSSSLLAAETTSPTTPQQQQQGADRSDVVTSPPQCGTKVAAVSPPTSYSSANHNNVRAELCSEQRPQNAGGGEGVEKLEICVDDEERGHDDALPEWLTEGSHVTVGSNKAGTVRYIGTTHFAEGVWVGVELNTPVGKCAFYSNLLIVKLWRAHGLCRLLYFLSSGKNDGSVGGHRYFHCKAGYGVLVRPDRLSSRDRNSQVPPSVHVPILRGEAITIRRGENRKSWSS